jgi:uncharacterized protein (TIGR02444 family)
VEGFWDFSVRTYRTPGVPEACLSMQNDHGADVNMLLYCCWVGAAAGPFDDELFRRASGYSARWAENVVIPLREARSWMKHTGCIAEPTPKESCMQLREQVKTVEFAAEKMQQQVLESLLSVEKSHAAATDPLIDDVAANLKRYLEGLDIQPAIEVRKKLSIIVCAAFPDFDKKTIAKAIETAS